MGRTLSGRTVGMLVVFAAVGVGAIWVDAATWNRDKVAAVAVCQDTVTTQRVPDQLCAAARPGDRWVYYRAGDDAPAIGGPATGGSATPPAGRGAVVTGGEPESGGEIASEPGGSSGSGGSSGEGGEGGGEGGGGEGGGGGGGSGGGGGGGGGE